MPAATLLVVCLLVSTGCGSSKSDVEPRVGPQFSIASPLWDQTSPAIYGTTVLWQSQGDTGSTIEGADVGGSEPKVVVAHAKGKDPAVGSDYCIWAIESTSRIGGAKLPTSSIRGMSLSAHERVDIFSQERSRLRFPTAALRSAVSGAIVVWTDLTVARFRSYMFGSRSSKKASSDIWYRKLPSGDEKALCAARGDQLFPDIDGNLVAWEDWRHVKNPTAKQGNSDIYAALLRTGTVIPVCRKKGQQSFPAVSGTRVVWMDRRNGDWDIYGADVMTGNEFQVYVGPGDQVMPDISGNLVVWVDYRDGNGDIYGCDLADGSVFPICSDPAEQDSPAASTGMVVWADKRNGTWDIYGARVQASVVRASVASGQVTTSAPAAPKSGQAERAVPWSEAERHVGETVTVEGPVISAVHAESSDGQPTFLNVGRDYPNPDRLAVVIWGDDRLAFPKTPENMYDGKIIRVTGVVDLYEGVPQIEVSSPGGISVVTQGVSPSTRCWPKTSR